MLFSSYKDTNIFALLQLFKQFFLYRTHVIVGIDTGRQKPQWAVEIKWSDRYTERPGELESLLWYMPKNGLTDAIVTSQTVTMMKEMNDVVLHFMPVACYTYTVARNTLENTRFLYGL